MAALKVVWIIHVFLCVIKNKGLDLMCVCVCVCQPHTQNLQTISYVSFIMWGKSSRQQLGEPVPYSDELWSIEKQKMLIWLLQLQLVNYGCDCRLYLLNYLQPHKWQNCFSLSWRVIRDSTQRLWQMQLKGKWKYFFIGWHLLWIVES